MNPLALAVGTRTVCFCGAPAHVAWVTKDGVAFRAVWCSANRSHVMGMGFGDAGIAAIKGERKN